MKQHGLKPLIRRRKLSEIKIIRLTKLNKEAGRKVLEQVVRNRPWDIWTVSIRDYLDDENLLCGIFETFSCPKNKDIEDFLRLKNGDTRKLINLINRSKIKRPY